MKLELPPTIARLKKTQRNTKLTRVISKNLEYFPEYFTDKFMGDYTTKVVAYFRSRKIKVSRSDFLFPRNRNLVYNWAKKIDDRVSKDFPFPIDVLEDKNIYRNVSFWISVLDTLFVSADSDKIHMYTQTMNGIFLYVASGRYGADFRSKELDNLNLILLNKKIISKLKKVDYRNIFGVYVIMLYEYAHKRKLRRSEKYYKYVGYIFIDGVPAFRKDMIQHSGFFRAMLIEFEKYYFKMLEYFNLEDDLDYPGMLLYLSKYPVDVSGDTVFSGYSVDNISHFIESFADYILG